MLFAVVDAGSLNAAAARLPLSVSAISRIVSGLESDLGLTLFDRAARRMKPTAACLEFYARARDALMLWDDLQSFGQRSRDVARPVVRVAALSRHDETVVAPAMARLLGRRASPLRVRLDVHWQRDFAYSRMARPFDVGFGNLMTRHDDLEITDVARSRIVAVVRASDKLARRKRVHPSELADLRRIDLSGETAIGSRVLETIIGSLDRDRGLVAEVSHTAQALAMARLGAGVQVTDELAAIGSASAGCRLLPLSTEAHVAFSVFWPRRSTPLGPEVSAACLAVVNRLRRAGATMDRSGLRLLASRLSVGI